MWCCLLFWLSQCRQSGIMIKFDFTTQKFSSTSFIYFQICGVLRIYFLIYNILLYYHMVIDIYKMYGTWRYMIFIWLKRIWELYKWLSKECSMFQRNLQCPQGQTFLSLIGDHWERGLYRSLKQNRWNNGLPKDVHILFSRTYERAILHSKRVFADVIEDFEMGKLSWIIQMPPLLSQSL